MSATGKHSITPTHLRVVLAEGAPANWCKPAAHDRRCSASTMPASSSTTGKRPRPPRLPPHLGQCHAVCAQAAGECCWDALVRRVGQLHLEGLSLEQRDHLLAGEEAARVGGMTRREERGTQRGSSNSLRQMKHSAHWQRGVVLNTRAIQPSHRLQKSRHCAVHNSVLLWSSCYLLLVTAPAETCHTKHGCGACMLSKQLMLQQGQPQAACCQQHIHLSPVLCEQHVCLGLPVLVLVVQRDAVRHRVLHVKVAHLQGQQRAAASAPANANITSTQL